MQSYQFQPPAFVVAPPVSPPVGIVWQTTFDDIQFPDRRPGEHWRQSDLLSDAAVGIVGDGIKGYGGWTVNGFEDRIIAEANHPGGLGGKGFRHYRGDGTNRNGGGILISLPSTYPELWCRFYMRYQSGFAWSPAGQPLYTKDMYVNVGSAQSWAYGIQGGGARWGIFNGSSGVPSTKTWTDVMGGPVGDGLWHCYEWHIQHGTNALVEIWIDDVQYLSTRTTMRPGGTSYLALGSNQHSVTGAGATPWYTDYDDIAVSNLGRIGPL